MNLVGHNMALVEELKKYMLNQIKGFHRDGYIKEDRYEELLAKETKVFDDRLDMMKQWL